MTDVITSVPSCWSPPTLPAASSAPSRANRRGRDRALRDQGDLRITELARDVGATTRALRYYEDLGLILPARTRGGTRVYGVETRRRAAVIVGFRQLGLSLEDIVKALGPVSGGGQDTRHLRRLLQARLEDLDRTRGRVAKALADLDVSA